MTKADMKRNIAGAAGVSRKYAGELLDLILGSMVRALQRGENIEIRGFGSFVVRTRRSREARNPRTGVMVNVPARRFAMFRLSPTLAESLNGRNRAGLLGGPVRKAKAPDQSCS